MKIDWKSKLTSRKFWAAVIAFITAVMAAFGVPDITVTQVTAVVMAAGTMIAYIIGEGLVDAARTKNTSQNQTVSASGTQAENTTKEGE